MCLSNVCIMMFLICVFCVCISKIFAILEMFHCWISNVYREIKVNSITIFDPAFIHQARTIHFTNQQAPSDYVYCEYIHRTYIQGQISGVPKLSYKIMDLAEYPDG